MAQRVIRPQPGPQEQFLATSADIAIYGGAAGGGKSFALLLEPLRHVSNPDFGGVIFRRTTVQIKNEGALWDESAKLYPDCGGTPKAHELWWKWGSGASIAFAHLEHEKNVLDYQGAQIPFIGFDELTHFTEKQFWYMVSRNRSMCGVQPYIRATCNPDADSWVAKLIKWWINQETGLAIPERAGVIRYFVRVGDEIIWADRPEDLAKYVDSVTGEPIPPKSLTFIPAKLSDNKALLANDPGYVANLMALPTVERERLLGGNWKIKASAGLLFKRTWCEVVRAVPAGVRWIRGWDLAASVPTPEYPDPDWTSGTKMGRLPDGRFIVGHHVKDRLGPGGVETLIKNTASQDKAETEISLPKDPGQAGKSQVRHLASQLAGYTVRSTPESGDKVTRFSPFSAQAEAGNVLVLEGDWNEEWFAALEAFGAEGVKDDVPDSTSRAFNALVSGVTETKTSTVEGLI